MYIYLGFSTYIPVTMHQLQLLVLINIDKLINNTCNLWPSLKHPFYTYHLFIFIINALVLLTLFYRHSSIAATRAIYIRQHSKNVFFYTLRFTYRSRDQKHDLSIDLYGLKVALREGYSRVEPTRGGPFRFKHAVIRKWAGLIGVN